LFYLSSQPAGEKEKTMAKAPEHETFMDMFSKLGQDLKLPGVDVQSILDHNRKNLEALQKSASATAEGASALMARQREMLQEALREITGMAQNFHPSGNPQEMVSRQAEFARKSFETAVKNAGEMAEIVKKSGSESIEILRQRIRESMREVREGYEKRK
jgi:phasin family protein